MDSRYEWWPLRVIGVVGHVRHWGLASDDQAQVRAQVYYPFAQVPEPFLRRWSELMSIAVRTTIAPLNMVEPLRREVRGTASDQVLYEVRTMEQLVSDTLARQRFLVAIVWYIRRPGVVARLHRNLWRAGIPDQPTRSGNRRTHGAWGDGSRCHAAGSSAELAHHFRRCGRGHMAAVAAGRVLGRLVEGMQPAQPSTFAFMIGVLVLAALIASFLPARRASRIDPMRALRQE